jgi:hypothetical protein
MLLELQACFLGEATRPGYIGGFLPFEHAADDFSLQGHNSVTILRGQAWLLPSMIGCLPDGIHHGPEILQWNIQLHVMGRSNEQTAARSDGIDAGDDLLI